MAVHHTEDERRAYLRDAESKAAALFEEIEAKLIRSGISEKQLSDEIHALGKERYNVRTHWHKRVVRAGEHTLLPFEENPPDRTIRDGDMLVVDLGPVFQDWEADFGRTYVLGNDDPGKLRLRDDLEPMWYEMKARFDATPDMTGQDLFRLGNKMAEEKGYVWGAHIAGHLVGDFPHERIPQDKITLYIAEGNTQPLNTPGKDGHRRHWILEVHLRDAQGRYGGFFEQILTVE